MPRAMWSGAISFGLVNIPIKLFNAVSRKNVCFNQIDTRTGSRIQYRKVSAADGEEVPNEAIAKGYQLSSGEYVLVGDDELAALDPEATRTIDIEQFVDLDEIDPIFYDSPTTWRRQGGPQALRPAEPGHGGAGQGGDRPLRHAHQAVPGAHPPGDGMLVMSTMVYADEVNDPAQCSTASRTCTTSTSASGSCAWPSSSSSR